MTWPTYGVPLSTLDLDAQTPDLFDCDFRALEQDVDGTIITPSGHVGTFSRAATLASVADAVGATYTALDGQPAWEQRDWDNDGVREAFGLRMGTADRLVFPTNLRSTIAIAGLLEVIEVGARTSASSCLWSLREDAASGAGLWLDTSGTYYRFNYRDGATTRTATLVSGQPVSGDRVQFFWELTASGVLTFYQSINGAAATSASAAALTLPSAWATSAKIRLNANGTGNAGQAWYRRCRLVAGALNQTTIVERR